MTTVETPMMDLIRFQLRRVRSVHQLSQEQFGKRINYSASLVSAVELGQRPLDAPYLARVDEVFETGGLLVQLLENAQRDGEPSWFGPWRKAEEEATHLHSYEPNLITGLLQTEAYARAVIRAGGPFGAQEVEHRVTARLERQAILTGDRPTELIAVLDQAALHRLVGDAAVMSEQLTHLLVMGDLPHVDLHLVPADAGVYIGMAGPFVLAGFEDGGWVGYLDNQLRGQLVTHGNDIARLRKAWERIRSVALPHRQTVNLIKEVAQTWT